MFGEVGPGAPDAAAHDGGFPFSSPAGPLRRPVPEEVPCLSPIRVAPPPGQNDASCHLMITPASSSPSRPPASSAHERLLHSSEAFSCLGTRSDENDRTPMLDTPTPDISPFDFSMSRMKKTKRCDEWKNTPRPAFPRRYKSFLSSASLTRGKSAAGVFKFVADGEYQSGLCFVLTMSLNKSSALPPNNFEAASFALRLGT